jgi:hypothetical protein
LGLWLRSEATAAIVSSVYVAAIKYGGTRARFDPCQYAIGTVMYGRPLSRAPDRSLRDGALGLKVIGISNGHVEAALAAADRLTVAAGKQ